MPIIKAVWASNPDRENHDRIAIGGGIGCYFDQSAPVGGAGLGLMGGLGLAVLVSGFHLPLTSAPIDAMLMILAAITAPGGLQAAGGMDWLVRVAERLLRRNPKRITFFAPLVTYTIRWDGMLRAARGVADLAQAMNLACGLTSGDPSRTASSRPQRTCSAAPGVVSGSGLVKLVL